MSGVLNSICPPDINRDWLRSAMELPKSKPRRPGEFLRFEAMMMSLAQSDVDPQLTVLECLGNCDRPNANHFILAQLIRAGAVVMTVNFDTLIEIAYARSATTGDKPLRVIAVDEDFPPEIPDNGAPVLWKLHGTWERGSTVQATLTSVLAPAMGDRKTKFLQDVIQKRDVLFAGYSGSDDLDLLPVFTDTRSSKKLFWIYHSNIDKPELKKGPKCLEVSEAESELDLIGRPRLFHALNKMADVQRDANNIVCISGRTDQILQELGTFAAPEASEENYDLSPDSYFARWAKNLASSPSAVYEFILELFQNRWFRPDTRLQLDKIRQTLSNVRNRPNALPEERLSQLMDDYNNETLAPHVVESRLKELMPSLPKSNRSRALRLLACARSASDEVDHHGFRKALEAARAAGNLREEMATLQTWRSFAQFSQWSELFPEFESQQVLDAVGADAIHRMRTQWRTLQRDAFPEEESRRFVEVIHQLGMLPVLWKMNLRALTDVIDVEYPMNVILSHKLSRLLRFSIDMGDVAGEQQVSIALARLYLSGEQYQAAAMFLLRARELGQLVNHSSTQGNLEYFLGGLHSQAPETISSVDLKSLRRSMWWA